jgi:hypothetical protein
VKVFIKDYELTHIISEKKVGEIADVKMPVWINEGY